MKNTSEPTATESKPVGSFSGYSVQYNGYQIPVSQPQALEIVGKPRMYPGFIRGFKQPTCYLKVRIQSNVNDEILKQAYKLYFSSFNLPVDNILQCFAELICALQKDGGMPIFDKPSVNQINNHEYELWLPMLFAQAVMQIVVHVSNFFNSYLNKTSFIADDKWLRQTKDIVNNLKKHAPQGSNSLKFLAAAHELDIPWMHFALNTFKYGYGKYSRLMDSSFTDKTSQVSAGLANNKHVISTLLYRHGFPVPHQVVVNSETDAMQQAVHIGFPVVIKPIDGKHGIGVVTHLENQQSVRAAFGRARKHTQTVLLEKHIVGKDYRLVVFNGKFIWAIERIPAYVLGNGIDSIEALIAKHNEANASIYPLRHIQLTEDITSNLQQCNLSIHSVPSVNESVTLTRISNISAGGMPIAVTHEVHPDVKLLAESIAKFLRLDLVGIDFITNDISQSHHENGGKIIEVNVQPQLGSITSSHLYREILTGLIGDQGRMPIIVVYGKHNDRDKIIAQLIAEGVGVVIGTKVLMNGALIINAPNAYAAGQAVLAMQDCCALIYCIDSENEINTFGLPFDRYDHLVLLENIANDTLTLACRGEIINHNENLEIYKRLPWRIGTIKQDAGNISAHH